MLSIVEIKKKEVNSNVNLKGTVVEIGEMEQPSDANLKSKIFCIIADETGTISATIYCNGSESKFKKGAGIVLMNALWKESFLAITSKTDVGVCQPVIIPEEVEKSAPKLFTATKDEVTMSEALASPEKTLVAVKGKIMKISPSSTRISKGESIPYQEITLKDPSGSGIVAIWNDNVDRYSPGQKLKLSSCRVRLFQQKKRLTTTANCQTELISHSAELEDLSSDEDFVDEVATATINGTITALFDTDPYLSCIRPTCNNKKLITELEQEKYIMFCPSCNNRLTGSSANWYARITVMFSTETENRKLTIFKPEIQKILAAKKINTEIGLDKDKLIEKLLPLLPLSVKCIVKNNTLQNIVCKRQVNE